MKAIAYIMVKALYYAGHLVSYLVETKHGSKLYPLYNCLMIASFNLNERYSLDVWKEIE